MKKIKLLALLMALCMAVSLMGVGAAAKEAPAGLDAAADTFAQQDETHWAGEGLVVTGVTYAAEYTDAGYVDSTLFAQVSSIETSAGTIAVDSAVYTPILTVDGVQYDLYNISEETAFDGYSVITLVEKGDSSSNNGAPFGADKAQSSFGAFYYTPAIYVADGAYVAAKSAESALIAGEVSDTAVNGLTVDSEGDYFSAVYVVDSVYDINDANVRLIGACGDDFNGWGAGVVALGSSEVNINNSYMYGCGVLRSCVFSSGTAKVNVNDSVIITENDENEVAYDTTDNYATPMMQQCPFALGITGNIRATIACGSGCNSFTNSLVVSNGWAVLSTDSGKSGNTALVTNAMVAVVGTASDEETEDYDFTYEVNGKPWYVSVGRFGETSGYIAYADSGVLDYAYGSAWYSPDYLGIITSGGITMADNSYGYSGRIGFLLHSGGNGSGNGTLTVSDSSFDVQDIFAITQAQGSYVSNVTIDNCDIALANAGRDILFAQVDTDDNAGGPGETTNTITELTYDEYLAQEANPGSSYSTVSISNCTVQGNVYNAASVGTGVAVTLDNAELDGEISSAWSYHVDLDGEALGLQEYALDSFTGTADGSSGTWDYTLYLRLACQSAPARSNPVSVTMTNGAVWMITGTNYISSLTLDETSSIKGMGLTMTVNGVETEIAAGTYEGEIILSAGDAPSRGEGDAEIQAPVIGEAAIIEAAAAAEEAAAFEAQATVEPFNVDVGDGMVLEFSSVQYAFGDGTVSIFIPDTSKQIDCEIIDGEWVFADADFVDEAIIAAAKALSPEDAAAAPAEGDKKDEGIPAAEGEAYPGFEEYKEYLLGELLKDSFWQGNEETLRADLDAAETPYEESIQNFTGSGDVDQAPDGVVFPLTYDQWVAAN